jgi:hypothetical protein
VYSLQKTATIRAVEDSSLGIGRTLTQLGSARPACWDWHFAVGILT